MDAIQNEKQVLLADVKGSEPEMENIINQFKDEVEKNEGVETKSEKTESENIEVDPDALEGIPLIDLLDLCPPDMLRACLSPAQSLAYRAIAQDLDEDQADKIKPYFENSPEILNMKKELLLRIIKKRFPNYEGKKVSPEIAFLALEATLVYNSVRNAKNHLAEKKFLKERSDE